MTGAEAVLTILERIKDKDPAVLDRPTVHVSEPLAEALRLLAERVGSSE